MESEEQLCRNQRREAGIGFVLVLSIVGAMCGALEFGFNTGVINAPQTVIESFINSTLTDRGSSPSRATVSFLWSIIVSIFAVGGILGGSAAGWWADKFGRKRGLLLNNVCGLVGALLMAIAQTTRSFELLIIGRFLVGICSAIFTGLTPMYLSEVAPSHLRGALGTMNQLGVVIGLLISQVLGIGEILGTEYLWSVLLSLSAVPCVLMCIILPFCPESPRYLLITEGREKDAKIALKRLRGSTQVEEEIEEMKIEARKDSDVVKMGVFQLLKCRDLWKPLGIAVIMQLSQQLSGINAVFYYSTSIFQSSGLSQQAASYATMGVGGIMVVVCVVSIPLMDRAGRRTLHLLGLGGMFVASIIMTIGLALNGIVLWFHYVTVVFVLLFVAFFGIGPGSIPWMITAELFSQGPRPAAISIAIVVNWSANFVVGIGFPAMQLSLGDFTLIPFTVLLAVFWLYTYFMVPETKNLTFDQITAIFRKKPTLEIATST